MSGAAWIKFFPSDWLNGTIGLSGLEKGVYITLLALIYDRGGPIPNNPRLLARRCDVTPSQFSAAIKTLVEEGKLTVSAAEIFNKKAEKIILDAESRISKARKGGLAKAGKKDEENQSQNSAQATAKQKPSTARGVLEPCLDAAIPELDLERASKLALEGEGEGQGDSALEAELRHAAGWHHEAKRLSHVKPIADLIAQGLSLADDVIPTVRQLAHNVETQTSWTYFIGPLRDILKRRQKPEAPDTPTTTSTRPARVWVWKGTPQWDAWKLHRKDGREWPTSEQPHPAGGRKPGWYFDSEWPPPRDEKAA